MPWLAGQALFASTRASARVLILAADDKRAQAPNKA
jgi:hypothetical protein